MDTIKMQCPKNYELREHVISEVIHELNGDIYIHSEYCLACYEEYKLDYAEAKGNG